MFLKALLLTSCFLYTTVGKIILPCDDSCSIERSLRFSIDDFLFEACEEHLVHLEFLPDKKTDVWILMKDTDTDRKLFYKEGFDSSDDIVLLSSSNKVTLEHSFTEDSFASVDIRYRCQPYEKSVENITYGTGSLTRAVDANQVITYNLKSNKDVLDIDLGLEFPSPVAGFAKVNIGDGMYAVGFKQMSLSLDNPAQEKTCDVNILTSNIIMSGPPTPVIEFSYDLGEDTSFSSSTPAVSTSTTPSEDKIVTVYFISVLEEEFVGKYIKDFKNETWNIMRKGCPELPVDNGIYYSPSYSCRQVCSMSSETTRGCVMIGMHLENLPVSTYCNYTEDLSKIEYLTQKLRERSKEFKREYDAGRVSVDTCNAIGWTTQWVWVSVGLVGGVLVLSLLIMVNKRRFTRGGTSTRHLNIEPNMNEDKYQARRKIHYNDAFVFE